MIQLWWHKTLSTLLVSRCKTPPSCLLLGGIHLVKEGLLLHALKAEEKADCYVERVLIMGIINDDAVADINPGSEVG